MNDAHKIVEQVYAAKEDVRAADDLIRAYLPFIKAETAKFLKRPPIELSLIHISYCLYSLSRFSGGSTLLCAAFSEKPAVFVMKRIEFL